MNKGPVTLATIRSGYSVPPIGHKATLPVKINPVKIESKYDNSSV